MRVEIDRKTLADALKEVRAVVKPKHKLEPLRCALVRAADKRLRLEGTDLDTSIRVQVPAMVFGDGGALVPAALVAKIIERMPKKAEDGDPAMASLSAEEFIGGAKLHIEVGRVSATVAGMPAPEYPVIPWAADDAPRARLEASDLADALAATLPAVAAEDSSRVVLTGVCVETEAGLLRAIAVDGRRLHWAECPDAETPTDAQCAVIPAKCAKWVSKKLAGAGGKVAVVFAKGAVEFHFPDGTAYRSKTVEGVYPNWRQVVPASGGACATVKRDALAAAAMRSAALAEGCHSGGDVPMELEPLDGALAITTTTPDGRISEYVEATGPDALSKTSFNPTFLADALRAAGTGDVALRAADGNMPMLVSAVGAQRFAVVMPLRS